MATCLYKPKPCDQCGVVIPVGADCEYVPETKGVRHYRCEPKDEPPDEKAYRLASELGFVASDEPAPISEWRLWRNQPVNGKLF